MERLTNVLLFLILLVLTVSALGVSVITAVSVRDYLERQCF